VHHRYVFRAVGRDVAESSNSSAASHLPTEEFWAWSGHNIHLDRHPNPNSPAKVILHHGVGTNGRQTNLILGRWLADQGWEVTAIDNLGYGMTQVAEAPRTH
jgi:alpha-beta hydrolase superfamily lysophospholipase